MKMQLVSGLGFPPPFLIFAGEFGWQERIQTREADTGAVRRQAGMQAGGAELEDRKPGKRKEGGSLGDARPECTSASFFGSVIKKRINERQTHALLPLPQQLASPGKSLLCRRSSGGSRARRRRRSAHRLLVSADPSPAAGGLSSARSLSSQNTHPVPLSCSHLRISVSQPVPAMSHDHEEESETLSGYSAQRAARPFERSPRSSSPFKR